MNLKPKIVIIVMQNLMIKQLINKFREWQIMRQSSKFAKELKKKFGNSDIYILTARPPSAKHVIQAFLKGVGLDIKLENIVGLENGTPQAKANWITQKITEG